MKYLYILSVFCLAGCGSDGGTPAPSTPAPSASELATDMQSYIDENMPDLKKLCVDANLPLIESQRQSCLGGYTSLGFTDDNHYCDRAAADTTLRLNNLWNIMASQAETAMIECSADFRVTAAYCFGIHREEITRRLGDCEQVLY